MLPMIKAVFLARKAKQTYEGRNTTRAKTPMSKVTLVRLLAILPVLLTAIALLLSVLCVYAGHTPGYMKSYAVFTLNVSRIGEDQLASLDHKISSINLKRDLAVVVPTATNTFAPTTLVAMTPRGLGSDLSSLTSKVGSAVETNVIAAVNKAYHGVIADLDLKDFYSIHISSSCSGTYHFKNGTNITVGDSGVPGKGVHEHVDSCSAHSVIDPLQLIRVLYWAGIVLTAIALVLGFVGIARPTRKYALLNIFGTLPALVIICLASAVTHGVAVGAEHLINFIGKSVGVAGASGGRFLHLTWATTILLSVNVLLWILIFLVVRKEKGGATNAASGGFSWGRRTRVDRTGGIALGPISRPMPVQAHSDRYGNAMI
ncbi:hypothetical protein LTR62_004977 [Meristemomyces frigidus]|uniref:Actin cortical patch SUR7/pH-response regulator PalI n=1 Tax=Meristemomyces frigidus TaxID=1508187 RepID=A0AAN7YJB9_9PEZI|nr:hypothetical protein LTR62_004977 [Meristemomyces frigidus]